MLLFLPFYCADLKSADLRNCLVDIEKGISRLLESQATTFMTENKERSIGGLHCLAIDKLMRKKDPHFSDRDIAFRIGLINNFRGVGWDAITKDEIFTLLANPEVSSEMAQKYEQHYDAIYSQQCRKQVEKRKHSNARSYLPEKRSRQHEWSKSDEPKKDFEKRKHHDGQSSVLEKRARKSDLVTAGDE